MLKILITEITMASLLMISPEVIAASAREEDDKITISAEQKDVAATLYNDDLALVKDTRRVKLQPNFNKLAWGNVSAQISPETAQLRNLTNPAGFRLLEQNFDFDLLTPEKLLENYLGKEVAVIRTNPVTGTETRETAIVLAANNGVILKFADRIEAGPSGRLAFPAMPENYTTSRLW